jgi:hypothetical protein
LQRESLHPPTQQTTKSLTFRRAGWGNRAGKLLVKDERKRLGSGLGGVKEVMAHPWFASIDWDALVHKRIKPPFKPSIRCGYCSYRD